ncbi:MAG: hypothetical protein JXO51_11360 [Candidatus Aminicenantes bacterium]|nr:hypothetical protein [Candidatus Aminicenantes bacterium]
MKKPLVLWLLALLLTLVLAVYQRLSGPTHPLRGIEGNYGARVKYKLLRSWTSHRPLPVRVDGDGVVSMRLHHRRYPLIKGEAWTSVPMRTQEGAFQAEIPGQPAAGKVAYKVDVMTPDGTFQLNGGRPVVARFKNEVPAWLLILHVVFMFAALFLAFRTGLAALFGEGGWVKLLPWTLVVTAIGGLLIGPIVQKYAFGAFWSGFPLGGDLTDTKTLFMVVIWAFAFFLRKKSRWWIVLATVLMLALYLIPHSVLGSELDYRTGKIKTATALTR